MLANKIGPLAQADRPHLALLTRHRNLLGNAAIRNHLLDLRKHGCCWKWGFRPASRVLLVHVSWQLNQFRIRWICGDEKIIANTRSLNSWPS